MIAIPIQSGPNQYDLFIVLEDENLERLKAYDPGELKTERLGEPWQTFHIRSIHLLYANTDEARLLAASANLPDTIKQLERLCRGWEFQPNKGDHDGPYQRAGQN